MGIEYTREQQQVIDLRERNILVSAAAGSGKTAVLVERIITRLTKDPSPIDVDQLLVMTFTDAAAAEMKERIRAAIEKELEKKPDDAHLQRQSTLVHHAQIMTMHSFCLSVIREYFHTIDLDPGFRTGEGGEIELLKRDVLESVLETYYTKGEDAFYHFVECFATGKDDKKMEDIIFQLYRDSRSHPNPDAWLDSCVKEYDIKTVDALDKSAFSGRITEEVKYILADVRNNILLAKTICLEEDGPVAYLPAIEADLTLVCKLEKMESYTEMSQELLGLKWEGLKKNTSKDVLTEKIEKVKDIREKYKKVVGKIKEDYFFETPETLQEDMLDTKAHVAILVELVKAFSKAFSEKKQSKSIIDFNDMEHYALKILTREENGKLVPSAVAEEYQQKFKEIMIDEYQDSNLVQETILTSVSTISKGKNNVFMVGDVKQSIYSFRLSRPELFMEKYDTYSTEDSTKQRIDLCMNFRSRREVLDASNFIFEQIMTEKLGGIAYDEKAALYVGAKYEAYPNKETEVCFVDAAEISKKEEAQELEAKAVAREIKKLVGHHMVLDKKTNVYRTAKYSDIVILFRSVKEWADVFLHVFEEEGIPAYTVSKEGYFQTREIHMLLDYLRILDNPHQDIPFTAVLCSPFLGLSGEELALIKTGAKGKDFYEKAYNYSTHGESDLLVKKLTVFLEQYQMIRNVVPYTGIHSLLWKIMDETGYANYMATLPGGEQRKANLEMMIEKAIAFESTSYKGLFHFVRYIEQLHKYEEDCGEASVMEETTDVVRIMTIHKSKGLEFPIVFVSGMNKNFNLRSSYGSVVLHPQWGIGINTVDVETRIKSPTLLKKVIEKELQKEYIAEELRVLYVAMTRAKEKLFLTGAFEDLESALQRHSTLEKHEELTLPYMQLIKAKSYLDWVIAALYRNKVMAELLAHYEIYAPFQNPFYFKEVPIVVRHITQDEIWIEKVEEVFSDIVKKEALQSWDVSATYDLQIKEQIEEQFSFSYPYFEDQTRKQKISVSELKKQLYLEAEEIQEEVVIPLLPKFMQEEVEVTGVAKGTAYHKIMELLDFSKDYDEQILSAQIQLMIESEKMTRDAAEAVSVQDILSFLQSPIGVRMQNACKNGNLRKEQPFVLGDGESSEEIVLVQGIVDAYFEENGELVILDYKTDRVWNMEELKQRYRIQLEYYAKALEQIVGKPVKEKLIYSFTLGKVIEV